MDRISELADELLIKILSFLPTTKVAVSTSILSKRWECLWMWLPKLSFSSKRLRRFLSRNLPLHRAPVIESLHLDLYSECFKPKEIKLWLVVALSRNLRKLKIRYDRSSNKPDILPSSLYTCKSLVILELRGEICFDVPRMVCLPSLKTLQLVIYKYRLLSICPVLEDLEMHFDSENINAGMIIAIVPSLQSLSLYIPSDCEGVFDGLVIDTPSLKYLKLEDLNEGGHSYLIKNMPNLEDAYVDVRYPNISSLIKSITSAKRLTLCSETVYGDGFVFNQLEHLKLCVCSDSSNLLFRLLEDSPNLRVLDIFEIVGSFFHKQLFFNKCSQYGFSLIFLFHYDVLWEDPPKTVHESILSSLQTFNWSRYLGKRPQEKDLAVYILGKKRFSLKDVTYEEQHPPILYQYRRVKA